MTPKHSQRITLTIAAVAALGTVCGCVRNEPGLAESRLDRVAIDPARGELAVGGSMARPILMPDQAELDVLVFGDLSEPSMGN